MTSISNFHCTKQHRITERFLAEKESFSLQTKGELMVSLTSLGLKLKSRDSPPAKADCDVVCEALMMELECQIKDVERINREVDRDKKRMANIADYTWLISTPEKSFEIPQMERLALEELASKVRPEDSGDVISEFRNVVEGIPRNVTELSQVMRCIIEKNLIERSTKNDDDSTFRWLTRSMSQLRTLTSHTSGKVYPITDIELQNLPEPRRVKSMSDFPRTRELNMSV
ncbi:retina development in camera-type eye [Desmophyllum pertusum]|uniref:Retina development in camera-type eye n=1 Tax=Desmophyllum pertusum TaxID=174260 RepID=A0A9W9YIK5_9CNID|nr:retina development in camera-type eye [Desmophyllum pertusum]